MSRSQSPAVQLFLQCALAANRKLEIDAGPTRTVAAICRALDGLPLAIELAASRARSLTAGPDRRPARASASIGEHALRDLPDRQQTLQATIRWSYDLLDRRSAARCCAAPASFLGGFTLAALEAVADRPVHASSTSCSSQPRPPPGRRSLELLELCVRSPWKSSRPAVGSRAPAIAGYFATLVAAASQASIEGGAPGELAAPLLADHANLRAALEDAIEAGDEERALALALGLRPCGSPGCCAGESGARRPAVGSLRDPE